MQPTLKINKRQEKISKHDHLSYCNNTWISFRQLAITHLVDKTYCGKMLSEVFVIIIYVNKYASYDDIQSCLLISSRLMIFLQTCLRTSWCVIPGHVNIKQLNHGNIIATFGRSIEASVLSWRKHTYQISITTLYKQFIYNEEWLCHIYSK